jgi:hypothetical protein
MKGKSGSMTLAGTLSLLGLTTGLVSSLIAANSRQIAALEERTRAQALEVEHRLTRIEEKLDALGHTLAPKRTVMRR